MSDFRFDSRTHTYWFGSRRITGITEALKSVGLSKEVPEIGRAAENFAYARERGSAVHKMCELDDKGQAEHFTMDANLMGYLEAWRKFKREYDFRPEIVEKPLSHHIYFFGGRPDVAGPIKLLRPKKVGTNYAVVERKTCDLTDEVGFQLALQELLVSEEARVARALTLAVKLMADGKYTVQSYDAKKYRELALAAVGISNWKISRGD